MFLKYHLAQKGDGSYPIFSTQGKSVNYPKVQNLHRNLDFIAKLDAGQNFPRSWTMFNTLIHPLTPK